MPNLEPPTVRAVLSLGPIPQREPQLLRERLLPELRRQLPQGVGEAASQAVHAPFLVRPDRVAADGQAPGVEHILVVLFEQQAPSPEDALLLVHVEELVIQVRANHGALHDVLHLRQPCFHTL